MTTCRKRRIPQILLFVFSLALSNCVTEEYNLSDINGDVTIGGDSLTIPIGQTDSITLKSLLDGDSIAELKETLNGYALKVSDSSQVKIDPVDPVSFTIDAIKIDPITTTLSSVEFPNFTITPFKLEGTSLPIPDLVIADKKISAINESFNVVEPLTLPPIPPGTDVDVTIGPLALGKNGSIDQSLNFSFPTELKRVNEISFTNSKLSITFDKSKINQLGFSSITDKVKKFRIGFPSEFKLSNAQGGSIIETADSSLFVIENGPLANASFDIKRMVLPATSAQNGALAFNGKINYTFDYSFTGTINSKNVPTNPQIEIGVTLVSTPQIGDMQVVTNPIGVSVSGQNATNKEIASIPSAISKVNYLVLKDGAELVLSFVTPNIAPFSFQNGGNFILTLPKSFKFKPYNVPGITLDYSTNILTVPYSKLSDIKPIGIERIDLNQVIPSTHVITFSDNLAYSISDNIVSTTANLYTLQALSKSINVTANITNLSILSADVTTNKIDIDIPNQNTKIDITQSVSKDVKKIYTVGLKSPAQLKFKILVNNLPASISKIYLDNYKIALPKSLKFKTGDVNANNEFIINEGFDVSTGLTKTLTLESFDFGTSGNTLTNGIFNLHESVTMTGGAHVESTTLKSSDIKDVVITPSITIGDMTLAKIEGEVSPVIEAVDENVKLDLPDALKNDGNNLDVKNPVITLSVGNTLGIPVDIKLKLIPKKKGVAIAGSTIESPELRISAQEATKLGQTKWSKFRLSAIPTGITDDHTIVLIPNLSNLLKTIPDEIAIQSTPVISNSQHHYLDLYSPKNQIDFKYAVDVPLDFGEDFKLQFNDTIEDLQKDLKDILKLTRNVDILANVVSDIPMDLAFAFKPCETNFTPISGVTVNSSTITTGSKPFSLGIKETETGALDKLDKFIVTVTATKSLATQLIPLKPEQYMKLKLKVRLPKGVTISK